MESFIEKLQIWISKTGFTNAAWLAIAAGAWVLMGDLFAGAALGIFCYINFNVIWKLMYNLYQKLV